MRSKPVALLLADLSVTKTHIRPYTSNDNPYSESQFRTMKYRPDFPDRFGCIQDSRALCQTFFPWYNDDHRHSGIGMMTPATVHYGLATAVRENRQAALDVVYAARPETARGQLHSILREVNRRRGLARYEPVPRSCVRVRRHIVKPFEQFGFPSPPAGVTDVFRPVDPDPAYGVDPAATESLLAVRR